MKSIGAMLNPSCPYRVSPVEVFSQPFALKPSAVGSCLRAIFVEGKSAPGGHCFVGFPNQTPHACNFLNFYPTDDFLVAYSNDYNGNSVQLRSNRERNF